MFGQNFLRFVTGLDWSVVKTCILLSADFGCEVHGLVSTVRPRMDGDHVTKYFTVPELASMVAVSGDDVEAVAKAHNADEDQLA